MIDQAERLAAAVQDDIDAINQLHAAIDSLPDTKVVNVIYRLTTEGTAPDIVQGGTTPTGGTGDVDNIIRETRALMDEAEAARAAAMAQQDLRDATAETSRVTAGQIRDAQRVAAAIYGANLELKDIARAEAKAASSLGVLTEQLFEEADAEARASRAVLEHEIALGQAAAAAERAAADFGATAREVDQLDQAIYTARKELDEIAAAELHAAEQGAIHADQLREEENLMEGLNIVADAALAKMAEDAAAHEFATKALADYEETLRTMPGVMGYVARATEEDGLTMLALAVAAKAAGGSLGALVIPTGAAAFGMGGAAVIFGLSAQALHLIVMGTFEFLAVFIPAMYAAGAAAAVLYQGLGEHVVPQINAVRTAAEALHTMTNTTAGDVLGLGHSLQIAQNMANPGAYELLGEAILGVNAAMGKLNSQGLSPFAQLGLDVTHMLDQFGAKMVVDLSSNMGAVNTLLRNSMQDLQEFGQIFGNLGHAILNFAAAMPGAAEIVLRLIDGFSALIKWVSQLPPALIYVVMAIEELYRWSGVLMGIFSMLGRAIALVGTLGIPVFAKIGMNFGAMVANVITGVAGMIVNFVAMGEKIGAFGARVDGVATKMVGALGAAADFMTGPWGAAIALGGLALAGFLIWMSHWHSATEQFIADTNQMVSSATNLHVMNTIAKGMSDTTDQLTQAEKNLHDAQVNAASSSNTVASRYEGISRAADQAAGAVQALTNEQHHLADQNLTVIQGAEAIAKTYHVSYASALAMADMAGVKLVNGFVGQSKAAQQAQLQIQALYLGYQKMDLAGGALNNTIEALNVQAGIQASQVGKVNSAWDAFIQLSTSLTGAYSQLLLDFQQLGNVAPTVGGKVRAFATDAQGTQMTVGQIAQALTKFSGSSAQVWQSFNQSITQANSLLDAFRTASVAGVVTQKQYTQAVATVVGELLPYAAKSKAAAAEVSALAQEAGGPATSSFQALKKWVDENGVSSGKFGGMIDSLTQKLSNVTGVARSFASTLQTDVLNAMAQAGIDTSNITGLTQDYTNKLHALGAEAGPTKRAQDALTAALKQYGFHANEIKQIEQELTGTFGKTSGAAHTLSNNFDGAKGKTEHLAAQIWNNLIPSLSHIPRNVNTNINITQTGVNPQTLVQQLTQVPGTYNVGLPPPPKHAQGGVLPGYSPGHDSVLAMLSPGEGILTPQAVRMIGPGAVHHLNHVARHFAGGGIYSNYERNYLMPELTLAYSGGGGRPGATAVAGTGGTPPVEVHLHGDLAMDGLWDRLQVQTVRYNLRNSGRVNGGWSPL